MPIALPSPNQNASSKSQTCSFLSGKDPAWRTKTLRMPLSRRRVLSNRGSVEVLGMTARNFQSLKPPVAVDA